MVADMIVSLHVPDPDPSGMRFHVIKNRAARPGVSKFRPDLARFGDGVWAPAARRRPRAPRTRRERKALRARAHAARLRHEERARRVGVRPEELAAADETAARLSQRVRFSKFAFGVDYGVHDHVVVTTVQTGRASGAKSSVPPQVLPPRSQAADDLREVLRARWGRP